MADRIVFTVFILTLFAILVCITFDVPTAFAPLIVAPFAVAVIASVWMHRS